MRYDPRDPGSQANDVFVLSKGHAAPILYAAWAEAGAFPREELLTLRRIDSKFEGHPTPELPFVPVATGSLGQGLAVGAGIAFSVKRLEHTDQRVYVLMGDGESAEGSNWEAAQWAAFQGLNNLCATVDIHFSTLFSDSINAVLISYSSTALVLFPSFTLLKRRQTTPVRIAAT
jgi:transketolase